MQLGQKASVNNRVELMEVMMSLITRKLGLSSMSKEDRDVYLQSVRSTGASLLGTRGLLLYAPVVRNRSLEDNAQSCALYSDAYI